ncbi:MAG: Translocation and assembly module TamA precursor [Candidatus Dependentiae bacterium ADurb.Bin331]|nr:MAG: Translocation and assembly module TamA precursor [Candidatus Dependentiae bacterium ADurb.Bin331]
MVTPFICLKPDARFLINNVSVSIDREILDDEHAHFIEKLRKRTNYKLASTYCITRTISQQTQAMKDYLAKKGYVNAQIELITTINQENYTVDLQFKIKIGNQRRFIFFGNNFFSTKELIEQCATFGRSADLVPLSLIVEEITERYRSKGFWQVAIEIQAEGQRCFFLINEGIRAQLSAINFDGVHCTTPEWLRKKFFKKNKKECSVDLDLIKQRLSEIIKWYNENGFGLAEIMQQEFVSTNMPHDYQLNVMINEGVQALVKQVHIDQFEQLEKADLFQAINRGNAVPLSQTLLNDQKKWLLNFFQQRGYLSVQVKPEIIAENGLIKIVWHVSNYDQQITFGKTVVLGATTLPFSLLQKTINYKQGEAWNKDQVRQSFLKLRELEVFETIYAHGDTAPEDDKEKAVLLKLIHDDPYEIRIRGGFQQVSKNFAFKSGTTYKIGGSLLIKNPFNYADMLRVDIDVTRFYSNFSGIYRRPWFLGLPLNLILKGYNNTYMQPVMLGLAKPLYQARQQGGMIGVVYSSDKKELSLNAGVELIETNHLSIELARAINFEPVLIDKLVPYGYFEPTIFMDCLDDKLNPRSGSLTVLTGKGMIPFDKNGVPFFKFLLEEAIFVPLWRTVLGFHIRFGYIFSRQFENIMPIDRFYLGGENSLRGYAPDLAPPLGCFVDDNEKSYLVPQGGRFVFNGNIELRFPIIQRLWGAIFEDVGILLSRAPVSIIDGNALLGSTGFGLRYQTPIGPLRFDIGWKWRKREPEEHLYSWFITLGYAF